MFNLLKKGKKKSTRGGKHTAVSRRTAKREAIKASKKEEMRNPWKWCA